jgi:hypothetical protein
MNHATKHALACRRYTKNSALLKAAFFLVCALLAIPVSLALGGVEHEVASHLNHGHLGTFAFMALGVVTLTTNQLLLLNIQSFRKRVPALLMMGTDFSQMSLRYMQQAIARIRSLPTASTYNAASGGYSNGAQSGRGLLTDVQLTIDQWGTVPVQLEHLNHIKDAINDYTGIIADAGYVLGKQVVDYVLGLVNFGRFSQSLTTTDYDVDMLIAAGEKMNLLGASAGERYMLVNSAVASVLAADQRLINSQWFGKEQGNETIRVWRNAFGFTEIREYADMPSGNVTAAAFTGVNSTDVLTQTAHGLKVGDRFQVATLSSGGSGLTAGNYYYVKTTPTADTFTLSATRGGSTQDLGSDVVTATGSRITNMVAFAFEQRAFAVAGGSPPTVTSELAAQFGIPVNTPVTSMYDPETQTSMGMACYQNPGTADLFVTPTMIYGARVGLDIGAANGTTCDYAGLIIKSA